MRAIAVESFGGADRLKPMDLPRPRPARDEVLIRVVAAGVNPEDCDVRRGALEGVLPHGFPLVPGFDVAGVVEEFGDRVSRFRKGDRVWGCALKPVLQWGSYADYVAVPEPGVGRMPAKLLFEEAAGFPLSGLTAYQSIATKGSPGAESAVLILDAAGGVGHFAVQFAKKTGAKVFATALAVDHEFVLGLGAAAAIDPTKENFVEVVRRHVPEGMDLVVDTLREPTKRAFEALRPGGRVVTTRMSLAAPRSAGVEGAEPIVTALDAEQLDLMARMVDAKQLRTHIQKMHSLADAAAAHETLEAGRVRGKLILNL